MSGNRPAQITARAPRLNDSGLSHSQSGWPGKFDAAKISIGELAAVSTRPLSLMNDNFSGGLENGPLLASPLKGEERRWNSDGAGSDPQRIEVIRRRAGPA